METTVIQIGLMQSIIGIVAVIATIGIAWGKMQAFSEYFKTSLDEVKSDLKDLRERFIVTEERTKNLWDRFSVVEDRVKIASEEKILPANSPRQLNEKAYKILNGSGIKEIIEQRQGEWLELVRAQHFTNPYDAQEFIVKTVEQLRNDPIVLEKIKPGAYIVGTDIGTILLVAGFYLRDLIFPELGFPLK